MFVYSMRASTLKFFGVTTLAVIALVALLVLLPGAEVPGTAMSGSMLETAETVRFDKIKTAEDRIGFLRQFGWEVEAEPVEEEKVTVPAEFDKVYQSYNELQNKQGFDLTKYRKKEVTRYTYQITNYPDYDGVVYANFLVYRNRVIGGDVCSEDVNGFLHGLDRNIAY